MLRILVTVLMSTLLLAGCKEGQEALQQGLAAGASGGIDLTGVPPERIILSPADQTLATGERLPMVATGVYMKGYAQEISEGITWSSSAPEIFAIDAQGQGLGLNEGQATITAEYLGVSASTRIFVNPAAISQVLIFPENLTVELPLENGQLVPQDVGLKAYALKTDGQLVELTDAVSWQIDEGSGLKDPGEGPGLYSAQSVGTWSVRITYDGFEASRQVNVTQEKKTLVSIRPSVTPLVLRLGQTLTLEAIGIYNDASESALPAWTLGDTTDLVTINGKQLTGAKTGSLATTLKAQGLQVPLDLYVQEPELTALTITPPSFTLYEGEIALYTVMASYGDGTSADVTSAVTAESTDINVLTVNAATARIQSVAQGSANLKVTYHGREVTALVAVDNPVLSRLEIRPSAIRVVAGRTENYQVFGIYSNGTEADMTALVNAQTLSTSRAEVPSGQPGDILGRISGSTILSATYVDPLTTRNVSGTATVTVDPPELLALTFDHSTASIALGRSYDFGVQGTYSDSTQVDVGSRIQITADVSSPGLSYVGSITRTTGNRIRIQSVAEGSMQIIATLDGISASATITVTEKELDLVQIRREQPYTNAGFMLKGSTADFTAVATFSDNSTVDVTNTNGNYTVTWTPPNPVVASFTDTGDGEKRLTGLTDGDAYFTITVQSPQGNASASFGIGVYIPCSGGGQYHSYQCWFLGTAGNSCDTTCSAVGRVTHDATISVAGSGASSSNECSNILNSLFRSSMNSFNSAATASQGIGCSIFTQSGLNLGLREATHATTGAASLANFRRVCSCE
ncbi:hypothetical protein [Oligoflexus tunisiensis]|uniref:hypothetical protein n=1 Tax=Oligoflexus tunisiensis TaxID=708132 RepID=UPI00114D3466|nr:hypothetical protein [Oligoflexus tunisiensis]